jgi:putative membrane protein
MKTFTRISLAMAMGTAALPAMAQTPPPPPPPEARTQAAAYVMAAGQSDLYEINSSQVALEKTQNPALRKYANMLIKHHMKTTAATMKAATKAGLTPTPPALAPGAVTSINELQTAAPADFDRIYLAQQIPAHQAALDLHQGYAGGGDQRPLKMSAKAAIPIVQQHLNAAMKMQGGNMAGHKM